MMVNAVGEPDSLEINDELVKFPVVPLVKGKVRDNSLKSLSYDKIVASKLIEGDVTAIKSGLCETVNVLFLLKRQLLKPV